MDDKDEREPTLTLRHSIYPDVKLDIIFFLKAKLPPRIAHTQSNACTSMGRIGTNRRFCMLSSLIAKRSKLTLQIKLNFQQNFC